MFSLSSEDNCTLFRRISEKLFQSAFWKLSEAAKWGNYRLPRLSCVGNGTPTEFRIPNATHMETPLLAEPVDSSSTKPMASYWHFCSKISSVPKEEHEEHKWPQSQACCTKGKAQLTPQLSCHQPGFIWIKVHCSCGRQKVIGCSTDFPDHLGRAVLELCVVELADQRKPEVRWNLCWSAGSPEHSCNASRRGAWSSSGLQEGQSCWHCRDLPTLPWYPNGPLTSQWQQVHTLEWFQAGCSIVLILEPDIPSGQWDINLPPVCVYNSSGNQLCAPMQKWFKAWLVFLVILWFHNKTLLWW